MIVNPPWGGTSSSGGPSPPVTVTYDPVNKGAGVVLSNGNLTAAGTVIDTVAISTTSKSNGKWYLEVLCDIYIASGEGGYGFVNSSASLNAFVGHDNNGFAVYENSGNLYRGGSVRATYYGTRAGDYVGLALDVDNGLFWFQAINPHPGIWNANPSANPATGVGGFSYSPVSGALYYASNLDVASKHTVNFGASTFQATIPSGFRAWQS